MKAKPFIIGGVIVAGLVAGYVALRKFYLQQIEKLQNEMTYQLVGFKLGKVSMDLVEIYLTLRLHSTSTLDAEIIDFFSDFLINGVKVAEIKLDKEKLSANMKTSGSKKNILPARGYSDIGIKIDLLPKQIKANVLGFIKSYITTKDLAVHLASGTVKVQMGWIRKEIKFDYATNLKELMQP